MNHFNGKLAPGAPRWWTRFVLCGRRSIFGLAGDEASFVRRRFVIGDRRARTHLEQAGSAFVAGYNAALEKASLSDLRAALAAQPDDLAGFAHEGSAMALALLDLLLPWTRKRWRRFADATDEHIYLTHVGAGWALARMRRQSVPHWLGCDPLLEPLLFDGFGFHEAFFHSEQIIRRRRRPALRNGDALAVFDQGVGRCLWFADCADPSRIAGSIEGFERERRADLWSGVGLAAAYAGGGSRETIAQLARIGAPMQPHIAQGVAFAARARQRAGNITEHTTLVSQFLCGVDADKAGNIAEDATRGLPRDRSFESYAEWRRRVREAFACE